MEINTVDIKGMIEMVKKIIDAVFIDMEGYSFAEYQELYGVKPIISMLYMLLNDNYEFDLEIKVRND